MVFPNGRKQKPGTICSGTPPTVPVRLRSKRNGMKENKEKYQFVTTRWTRTARAAGSNDTHDVQARGEFCEDYWYPIYAYLRRKGSSPHEAEDITQGFFSHSIMGKDILSSADPAKGRLRTYLLSCLENFLIDEHRRATSQKRDERRTVSIDAQAGEERYLREPVEHLSPDRCYDRAWCENLLARALEILNRKYARLGGDSQVNYLALRPFLDTPQISTEKLEDLAADLRIASGLVSVRLSRLRGEYNKTARELIKETVPDGSDESARAEWKALAQSINDERRPWRTE